MCRKQALMKTTLKLSRKNPSSMNHKLAALIVYKNCIIGTGFNHWKSYENSIHAEIHAIRRAKRIREDLRGAVIYVARSCKTKIGLAKPCSECLKAIKDEGIIKIIYTETCDINNLTYTITNI